MIIKIELIFEFKKENYEIWFVNLLKSVGLWYLGHSNPNCLRYGSILLLAPWYIHWPSHKMYTLSNKAMIVAHGWWIVHTIVRPPLARDFNTLVHCKDDTLSNPLQRNKNNKNDWCSAVGEYKAIISKYIVTTWPHWCHNNMRLLMKFWSLFHRPINSI